MIKWHKLTDKELYEVAEWAYRIGMPHLAKALLQDLAKRKLQAR